MYFFDDEKRRQELKLELDSWVGTPFRHKAGVKGMGCDCIHLEARVLENFGFGPFKIPWYPRDWHMHQTDDLLMREIGRQLPHEQGSLDDPHNGDIVFYKFGHSNSHAAFYFDARIYHAVDGVGVVRNPWMDKIWHKRKRLLIRVLG